MAQISQKALMALLFVGVLMGALDLVIIGPDLGPALRAAATADRTIEAPGQEKGYQAEL